MQQKITIATRGSRLALRQSEIAKGLLLAIFSEAESVPCQNTPSPDIKAVPAVPKVAPLDQPVGVSTVLISVKLGVTVTAIIYTLMLIY